MKKTTLLSLAMSVVSMIVISSASAFFWNTGVVELSPVKGQIAIPIKDISDGKSHHYKVRATDGLMVTFFVLKSSDGIIRAAVDACDVCYRSGKGYVQDGDFMVCTNCGQRFASTKINVIKGGCNPAPLERSVVKDQLVITMAEIDRNSWYMQYRQK